jgi:hypothetical protein
MLFRQRVEPLLKRRTEQVAGQGDAPRQRAATDRLRGLDEHDVGGALHGLEFSVEGDAANAIDAGDASAPNAPRGLDLFQPCFQTLDRSFAVCGSQGDRRFSRMSVRALTQGSSPAEVLRGSWPEKAEAWHARTGSSARYPLPDFP